MSLLMQTLRGAILTHNACIQIHTLSDFYKSNLANTVFAINNQLFISPIGTNLRFFFSQKKVATLLSSWAITFATI